MAGREAKVRVTRSLPGDDGRGVWTRCRRNATRVMPPATTCTDTAATRRATTARRRLGRAIKAKVEERSGPTRDADGEAVRGGGARRHRGDDGSAETPGQGMKVSDAGGGVWMKTLNSCSGHTCGFGRLAERVDAWVGRRAAMICSYEKNRTTPTEDEGMRPRRACADRFTYIYSSQTTCSRSLVQKFRKRGATRIINQTTRTERRTDSRVSFNRRGNSRRRTTAGERAARHVSVDDSDVI